MKRHPTVVSCFSTERYNIALILQIVGSSKPYMIISSVEKLLNGKAPGKVQSDASVREACKVMAELDQGALVVFDNEKLVGIVSERDVVRRCICADRHTGETAVAAIMTPAPVAIDADSSLAHALDVMQSGHFHHLPVMRDGQVIGLLELDDIPEDYRMLREHFRELSRPRS